MARLTRLHLPALLCVSLLCGCKATTPARTGPDAVYLAADYHSMKLETLAFLGLASLVSEPAGIQTTDALLRSYLLGGQQKFLIVDDSSLRVRAQAAGVGPALEKAIRAWKDDHTADALMLKDLGEKLGLDGFVVGDLTQWREETVDWTSEGASFTEVGIAITIYDARTGAVAWKGEKMAHRESQQYRHGTAVGSGVYRESSGLERTERAAKVVPPPPPAEEVAESVVQDLLLGLPDQPARTGRSTP